MARETQGIAPGWYLDPVDPAVQRWWDGEGWVGAPVPADATPPPGPPDPESRTPAEVVTARRGTPPPGAQLGLPAAPVGRGEPPAPPAVTPRRQPPARPHGYPLATPGARLIARLLDIGLVFGLNVLVNGWFVYQFVNELRPAMAEAWRRSLAGEPIEDLPATGDAQALFFVILVIAAALWFAYEVPAVANTGQTPGKRLLRIRVVRLESTEPVGFGRSFRRWYPMGLPTLFWSCYGLGFMFQVFDASYLLFDRPLQQALHDKYGHTAVVAVNHPKPAPEEDPDVPADPS